MTVSAPLPDLPALMTVPQVAEALGCTKMTVYRLIERGALQAARVGRLYRIHRDSVVALLTNTSKQGA